jgi:small-conductance mechanosensitive channel
MISLAATMQRKLARWTAAACVGAVAMQASAGIFDDEEARRAILDLRQKVETMRRDTDQKMAEEARRQTEEVAALRRSLLDLQNQLESSNSELAKVRHRGQQGAR